MPRVYVSVGSNIDPERNVEVAVKKLATEFAPLDVSSVYESAAVGFRGRPFYNLVVGFDTTLSVDVLNDRLKAIEHQSGRVRGPDAFVDRTIDLDIVIYGDFVSTDDAIDVPSKDILEYAFVLRPLAEIAPTLIHPREGVSIETLWQRFSERAQELEKVPLAL